MKHGNSFTVPFFSVADKALAYDEPIDCGGILVEPDPHYRMGADSLLILEGMCEPVIEAGRQAGIHLFIGAVHDGTFYLPMILDQALPAGWVAMAMRALIKRAGDDLNIFQPMPRSSGSDDLDLPLITLAMESPDEAWPQDEDGHFYTYPYWVGMGDAPEYPAVEVTDHRAIMALIGMDQSSRHDVRNVNPMDMPEALPLCMNHEDAWSRGLSPRDQAIALATAWRAVGFALHEIRLGLETWNQDLASPMSELDLAEVALEVFTIDSGTGCFMGRLTWDKALATA